MEISKDGTKIRYRDYQRWMDVDPQTGLVELDEGLFFHFKQTVTGIEGSIRTKRWWGDQVLYREGLGPVEVTSSEDLLKYSCSMRHYFDGGRAHSNYKARTILRSKKQAKYMGSYRNRDAREVDTV